MSFFRIIITAVIFFFAYRFLQRLMTPSSMRKEGIFGAAKREWTRRQTKEGAVDAEFEEVDDAK